MCNEQLSIRHFGPSSAIWVSGSTPTFGVAPCVGPQVERSGSFCDTWWNLDQQSGDPEILEIKHSGVFQKIKSNLIFPKQKKYRTSYVYVSGQIIAT